MIEGNTIENPFAYSYEDKFQFQVWDKQGNLLIHSANSPLEPLSDGQEGFSNIRIHKQPWRVFTTSNPNTGFTIGGEPVTISGRLMLGPLMPKNTRRRKIKVPEAMKTMAAEEAQNLVDMDQVIRDAIFKVEQAGIIFLDEIDKIAGNGQGHGPDVSREGVQRDLLPIVEGSTVNTKYGPVKTDHILFIASGAFHTIKPSDLIPELQGRFPIRVTLDALDHRDFYRILTEPQNALLLQYIALLKTDGVDLVFSDDAVAKIAEIAEEVNMRTENIGARRLHTLMERLLEDLLFDAPDGCDGRMEVDADYVAVKLKAIKDDEDLSRYIL